MISLPTDTPCVSLISLYHVFSYIDASAGKKRRRKRSIEAKMRQKRQIAIVELYEAMFLPENVIRGIHPKGGQLANSQIWLGSSHVFTNSETTNLRNFFTNFCEVDVFDCDQIDKKDSLQPSKKGKIIFRENFS